MFERLFRHGPQVEDAVWLDDAARAAGFPRQVLTAAEGAGAALVVVRQGTDLAPLAHSLAAQPPMVAEDGFALADLRKALAVPGRIGLTLPDLLARDLRRLDARHPVHAHVLRRGKRRADDDVLLKHLAAWEVTSVTFHNALDDALLRNHALRLKPLLQQLGAVPDSPIQSPLISRAIRNAQQD